MAERPFTTEVSAAHRPLSASASAETSTRLDPSSSLLDPAAEQLDTLAWLRRQHDAGILDRYAGEFVIACRGKLYGHGPDLGALRADLEPALLRDGVPADRWVEYFVA